MGMVAPALFHPLEGRSAPRLDPRVIPVPQGRGAAPKTANTPACLVGKSRHVDRWFFRLEEGQVESANVTASNKIGPLAGVIS